MVRRRNPIDEFFRKLDKLIRDIQLTTYEGFRSFLYGYVVQAIISAFVNLYFSPLGILVNVAFLLYTIYGFFVETGRMVFTFRARRILPFIIAVFAISLDTWLNLTIV